MDRRDMLHLPPGTRLGPYEIVALLGEGGMGVVYRARDSRLARDVAVKVLPPEFSSSVPRLARFEREARAAGSLNHPNILAVYDVGHDAGTAYLVTELLVGRTVRQVLDAGRLPEPDALRIAGGILRGLAAAHAQGIVHRDLKPENVFVTDDGHVKILDFGLAKLVPVLTSAETDSNAALSTLTDDGHTPGTAGYMSPEQVRGERVDTRTDIFSFGAVFYEMLAGARAFPGETRIDVLHAILHTAPAPLGDVAPALRQIVERCLEKSAARRFQSAADLEFALAGVHGSRETRARRLRPTRGTRRTNLALASALALAALGLAVYAGTRMAARESKAPLEFARLTFRRGFINNARLMPDGKSVIYTAAWDGNRPTTFFSPVRPAIPRDLHTPAPWRVAALSANGDAVFIDMQWVAYQRSVYGGTEKPLLRGVNHIDWDAQGKEFAVSLLDGALGQVSRLEYPVGRVLARGRGRLRGVRVAPDGRSVAFFDAYTADGVDTAELRVVGSEGHDILRIPGWLRITGDAWAPDGRHLYVTGRRDGFRDDLYVTDLRGHLHRVYGGPASLQLCDIAADGTALVLVGNEQYTVVLGSLRDKRQTPVHVFESTLLGELTADGRGVLVTETGEQNNGHARAYLWRGRDSVIVTLGEGAGIAVSPNGRLVLLQTHTSRGSELRMAPVGVGSSRHIDTRGLTPTGPATFWDDDFIVYSANVAGGATRCYVQSISGGTPRAITPAVGESGGRFAQLGTRGVILCCRDDSTRYFPADGTRPRCLGATRILGYPIGCSPDLQRAYFFVITGSGTPALLVSLDLRTLRRRVERELAPDDRSGFEWLGNAIMARDGVHYALGYRSDFDQLFLLRYLR